MIASDLNLEELSVLYALGELEPDIAFSVEMELIKHPELIDKVRKIQLMDDAFCVALSQQPLLETEYEEPVSTPAPSNLPDNDPTSSTDSPDNNSDKSNQDIFNKARSNFKIPIANDLSKMSTPFNQKGNAYKAEVFRTEESTNCNQTKPTKTAFVRIENGKVVEVKVVDKPRNWNRKSKQDPTEVLKRKIDLIHKNRLNNRRVK